MARPRKRENQGLLQNMLCRTRKRKNGNVTYYFYVLADGKEKPLGKDKALAILETAKLNLDRTLPTGIITFIDVIAKYEVEVIPNKARSTQFAHRCYISKLKAFFGNPPATLDQIEPKHIKMYLEWRKKSPASANNEVKIFHHIWQMAREWGYTKYPCPSEGISKHKLDKRDVYIEDHIYQKVYELCDQDMKDLMDVAYLTGQRPVDVVNIHQNHIFDGVLHITQQKTGAKLRMAIKGDLKEILDRRQAKYSGYLFLNSRGRKLTPAMLSIRFRKVRELAIATYPSLKNEIKQFQFRDLRAKAGTDKSLTAGDDAARKQLGHSSIQMTKRYIRRDAIVEPTKV
ncbi:tyrosine-type recombinase/integrase [Lonepinella koalarum]|uniref:tyrosine-type recombinase/integrase n=1 Tax=Lonepinella koalarum TaxID=53417 RepID=UPI0011E4687D|nr:tyrosine-type recombinase/integrase [Lonepinella koalarum]TYG35558.1 tyrosine-type recombinase/integrase [Lonepinella koalarum]